MFPGSFDLEAAESVCEADLDTLESLLEKSLLRRWSSGRLGLLETIREFAAAELDIQDERNDLVERHACFFLDLARRAEPELAGPALADRLERLAADQANMRGAVNMLGRLVDAQAEVR